MSCGCDPHYHGAIESEPELFDNFKGKRGYFLKKFLINDKFNLNKWRVTWPAMQKDIRTFIGQPLTLTPEQDHPAVEEQENFRVGTIIDVGLEEVGHLAWEIVKLKNKKIYDMVRTKKIRFGSPTVHTPKKYAEFLDKGTPMERTVLHRFIGKHDSIVSEPAYTKMVDKIVAVCTGDGPGCASKLLEVGAEVNDSATSQITVPKFVKKKATELIARLWQVERRRALFAAKEDGKGRWVTMPNGEPVFIEDGKNVGDAIREHFKNKDSGKPKESKPKSKPAGKNMSYQEYADKLDDIGRPHQRGFYSDLIPDNNNIRELREIHRDLRKEGTVDAAFKRAINRLDGARKAALQKMYDLSLEYHEQQKKKCHEAPTFYKGTDIAVLDKIIDTGQIKSNKYPFNSMSFDKEVSVKYAHDVVIDIDADSVRKKTKPVRYSPFSPIPHPDKHKDSWNSVHATALANDQEIRARNGVKPKIKALTFVNQEKSTYDDLRKKYADVTREINFVQESWWLEDKKRRNPSFAGAFNSPHLLDDFEAEHDFTKFKASELTSRLWGIARRQAVLRTAENFIPDPGEEAKDGIYWRTIDGRAIPFKKGESFEEQLKKGLGQQAYQKYKEKTKDGGKSREGEPKNAGPASRKDYARKISYHERDKILWKMRQKIREGNPVDDSFKESLGEQDNALLKLEANYMEAAKPDRKAILNSIPDSPFTKEMGKKYNLPDHAAKALISDFTAELFLHEPLMSQKELDNFYQARYDLADTIYRGTSTAELDSMTERTKFGEGGGGYDFISLTVNEEQGHDFMGSRGDEEGNPLTGVLLEFPKAEIDKHLVHQGYSMGHKLDSYELEKVQGRDWMSEEEHRMPDEKVLIKDVKFTMRFQAGLTPSQRRGAYIKYSKLGNVVFEGHDGE